MEQSDVERGRSRSGLEMLQELAQATAACEPSVDALLRCVAEKLNGGGFGYERVAIFSQGKTGFEPVPVAQHGFDDLEVLHGQLPPVGDWPLFHRALEERRAVWAADAQLDGDVPVQVAGSLRLRSLVGIPFLAAGECLGFGLADRGGKSFEPSEDELSALTTAGAFVAATLVGARATQQERRGSDLKSQFVALASHELRAPVAGIHGVTTTLRERGEDLLP